MRVLTLVAAAVVLVGCTDKVKLKTQVDSGPECEANERLINGECRFVCERDGDCQEGERCNLFVGKCEPRPEVDAGAQTVPCTEGAVRCATDGRAVERCDGSGHWLINQACATPDGFCSNEKCLACRPGTLRCAAGSSTVAEVCRDDGSSFRQITCAGSSQCVSGECRECALGQRRCSPDNLSVQECQRQPREDLSLAFVNAGDNFDGTCITQVCEPNPAPACRPPACIPTSTQCKDQATQQTCSSVGAWVDQVCSALPNMGATSECQAGACVDECGDAARAKSYFGCEYWTTVMDNVVDVNPFTRVTSGQGTTDSDFAFVVSNRSNLSAVVTITRVYSSNIQTVKTVTVPGRSDPTSKGVAVIKVPWQSLAPEIVGALSDSIGVTGQARYAYKLTSSRPVTVYQFNPLDAVISGVYAYSNDASLLLPAHIYGTSYVGLTPEHAVVRASSNSGDPENSGNGTLSIVATKPNTQVTVKASARTLAGGGIAAMAPGETRTFTLNSYDVLQLSSNMPSNVVGGSTVGNIECGANPYDSAACSFLGTCTKVCRVNSDLTGTIISSTEPIAVFGGSRCAQRGYLDTACDHVEEQLFPFVTWGQNFVGPRTAPLRLTNNTFASASNAGPDYYKIVAGCPDSQCPNGTTVTISGTTVAAGDVLAGSNGCDNGTSLSANTCRLRGGKFVEFRSKSSFKVSADKPIQMAQIFAGQDATTGTTRPDQGDPSLVLLPPIEQWRSSYTVLTAPGIKDNYLGITIDDSRVQSVSVNGTIVTTGWTTVTGTTFKVANVPVAVGTHTIQVSAKPGQTMIPGAGVTVYGFDSYVSYGYTGGLDLTSIVTGINPGG